MGFGLVALLLVPTLVAKLKKPGPDVMPPQ
jgi:hypothetical protein